MITFVAALDQNDAIGKNGGTPWHVSEDMAARDSLQIWHRYQGITESAGAWLRA